MTKEVDGGLLRAIEEAAHRAHDVDELAEHLRALPEVSSVEVGDLLVKTEPPIHEFAIQLENTRVVADVAEHPDGTLAVRGLHEEG